MSPEIPSGIEPERLRERGIKELERRHQQAMQTPEHSSRRKYTGATMLRRVWETPPHLKPGQRDT